MSEMEMEDESASMQMMDDESSGIMMIENNFFSEGSSHKKDLGPTIINSEPDGFICPKTQNTSFGKKKNVKLK